MIEIPYKLKKFILLKVCDKHTSKKVVKHYSKKFKNSHHLDRQK